MEEVDHGGGLETGRLPDRPLWQMAPREPTGTHGPKKQGFDEFFGIRDGFIDNYNHSLSYMPGGLS